MYFDIDVFSNVVSVKLVILRLEVVSAFNRRLTWIRFEVVGV